MQLQSTCPYCGVGCGIVADQQSGLQLSGDKEHPANYGRLCVKGSALAQTLGEQGRLLAPKVDGQTVSWPEAIDSIASRLSAIIAQYGPGSVAMYLSGQLLTEDYYVANKLMKGFIGSPHVDTNSRLCMASTVAGHKRAFGADIVPGCYADIELARCYILVGANMAWNHPVLFQRIQACKQQDPSRKIIVIDPRRSASSEGADLHLALKPGTDLLLFNGLLSFLAAEGALDQSFISAHTEGFFEALTIAQQQAGSIEQVALGCDLPVDHLEALYRAFVYEPLTLTLFSQGVNQAQNGTDKVNAIINCHLATGRIGKAGCGPFSLTGQPNAMGGREVGGLANQLAAHMDYSQNADIELVQEFWQAPNICRQPGYKAVDLFEAVERGEIKAIWIMATNPVVSMPEADKVKVALEACPLVIVSDIVSHTDTIACADIVLPATGWSEKDGTVTNSERRISRQRALLPAPGLARHDWQIMCDVAKAMGFGEYFNYSGPADIFAEHAALSAYKNNGQRAFDLSGLTQLTVQQYQELAPVQWPVNHKYPNGASRLGADGQFYTPSGKACFIAVSQQQPADVAANHLLLNTGRIRDQWHSMTRTGRAASLLQHRAEPFLEVHPQDAKQLGLSDGGLARLSNSLGHMDARVRLTEAQRSGECFVPIHWTEQFSSQGRCDVLVPALVDPVSGQPALKQAQVQIQPLALHWQVWLMAKPELDDLLWPLCRKSGYASKQKQNQTVLYQLELAEMTLAATAGGALDPTKLQQWLASLHLQPELCSQALALGHYRAAAFESEQLSCCVFISPTPLNLALQYLDQQFNKELSQHERRQLLTGRSSSGETQSAVICSCFQVREASICAAIRQGCHSYQQLGQQLKCGTNCGSCIPELKALIAAELSLQGETL
ncbi:MAG: nitrate reductase [Gammaproteobacteria bacterium]|nr:nitrate reductase [Gammaproteobacteria bacterium]